MNKLLLYKKEANYPCVEVRQKDGTIRPIKLPENAKSRNMFYEVGTDGKKHYFDGVMVRAYLASFKNFKTGETFEKIVPADSENLILPSDAKLINSIKSKTKDGKDFYHKKAVAVEVYEYTKTDAKTGQVHQYRVDVEDVKMYNCLVLGYNDGSIDILPIANSER